MWTIRLLDRKNGIKKYACGEFAHNLIWTLYINESLTFKTRRESRSFLRMDRSMFPEMWNEQKRRKIFASADVKVKVQIREIS